MNQSPDKFTPLRSLIEKTLDDSLNETEAAQLEALISQDPEQRHYYCQYLHMTIGLLRCCNDRIPAMTMPFSIPSGVIKTAFIPQPKAIPITPLPRIPSSTDSLSRTAPWTR